MVKKKIEKIGTLNSFYKGYDMRWLKNEKNHPDYYLVEEYEAKKQRKVGEK